MAAQRHNAMVEVIILAGEPRNSRRLIAGKNKFFVTIDNTRVGNIVVKAFEESDLTSSIYIIGNKTELEKEVSGRKVRKIIQQKGEFYLNALEAFHHTDHSEHPDKKVLYASCDIPFLNPQAIDDLVSTAPDVDFLLPYCPKEDFEKLFPHYRWPYQVYKEGEAKFGNVALVKPNKIKNKQLFSLFHDVRKMAVSDHRMEEFMNIPRAAFHALRLFGFEGFEIVLREVYLKYMATPLQLKTNAARRLSLDRIGQLLSRILECELRGVRTYYPELCFDIDNETTDLPYVVKNYEAITKIIQSR